MGWGLNAQRLESQQPIQSAPLQLQSIPDPEPGPGQLLLKVKACGVCLTDLHTVEGDL